ncbi:MAG: DUF805 domain-containing protein [Roseobacter sp.]
MTFQQAILTCIRKYFTFSGRATRSEYWWFFLFCILGGLLFGAMEGFINGITRTQNGPTLLSSAFNIATFIPSLAVGWRRMHDTGRSGFYLFYPLIALIGFGIFLSMFGEANVLNGDLSNISGLFGVIVMLSLLVIALSPFIVLYWLTRPSQPGQNQYGPNPYEVHP